MVTVMSYRIILLIVTLLSVLSVAGMKELGGVILMIIGMINIALWTWPRIDKALKEKNVHRIEGDKQIRAGNLNQAEEAMILAVADAERRKLSVSKRVTL